MYIMGQRSTEGTIPQSNLCTSDKKKTIWGRAEKKKSRARKMKSRKLRSELQEMESDEHHTQTKKEKKKEN